MPFIRSTTAKNSLFCILVMKFNIYYLILPDFQRGQKLSWAKKRGDLSSLFPPTSRRLPLSLISLSVCSSQHQWFERPIQFLQWGQRWSLHFIHSLAFSDRREIIHFRKNRAGFQTTTCPRTLSIFSRSNTPFNWGYRVHYIHGWQRKCMTSPPSVVLRL